MKTLKDNAGIKATIFTGTSKNFDWSLTLRDSAGKVIDISFWKLTAIIKQGLSYSNGLAIMPAVSCKITDGPNGVLTVPLATATITGEMEDAVLIVWREIGNRKKVVSMYYIDVIESALR